MMTESSFQAKPALKTLLFIRTTSLTVGAAAAGVGCYAAYEAAAKADGGYLMIAAPIVALAAAVIPCYAERACHDRQWLRAIALALVWVPCALTVFYSAVERNHFAKAGQEAERASLRTTVQRAKQELIEMKASADKATLAANKVRGLDMKACKNSCQSIKATETAAINRAAVAAKALAATEAKAVTESEMKAPDWLLPLSVDIAGMFLIACGFGLGRKPKIEAKEVASQAKQELPVVEAPAIAAEMEIEAPTKSKPSKASLAAKKGWETRRGNMAKKTGPVLRTSAGELVKTNA
jgi:hypothetical protein